VVNGEDRDRRAWPLPGAHATTRREPDAALAASPRGAETPIRHGEDQARDLALMRRVAAGDEAALAVLYDCYAAQINGLARTILRDTALAEEATHDVFLRLWQQPAAYDPTRGTFAGWVSRVARNRALDLLRQRHEDSIGGAEEDDPVLRIPDPAPDPEEQAFARLRREEVWQALGTLPPHQRQLLELAYFTGLSHREMAERLERPLGTVKSQIRAAMRRLADRLARTDARPTWPPGGSDVSSRDPE
jgi:RNA polymerase sigma-70 factor, ECF subfamily